MVECKVTLTIISIHAPRAGRDQADAIYPGSTLEISIHAPRAGRDGRRFV